MSYYSPPAPAGGLLLVCPAISQILITPVKHTPCPAHFLTTLASSASGMLWLGRSSSTPPAS